MTFASLQICHGSFFTALLKWLIYHRLFLVLYPGHGRTVYCTAVPGIPCYCAIRLQDWRLRIGLNAFLEAAAAKAEHSGLNPQGKSQELQQKLLV